MSRAKSGMSKELSELITAIGECRSKHEEDKIMSQESLKLKELIKSPKSTPFQRREYLVRSLYLEMLGHDASFSYLHAVNLTQDKNILNKRVGYLACALLLNEDSEFYILLVASLQKDLQSKDWVEVCMALGAIAHFSNSLIIQAVSEPVIKLMDSKDSKIRKKVAMVLYKFYQIDKNSVPDISAKMKKLLCDYDPSVMGATLPYYKEVARENPEKIKYLVGPFVVILKQVIDNKLPKEYIYHKFQGPWIQNTILEILSYLGKDDKQNSELIYEVLNMCLKNAENARNNIGYATVYQCVKTICNIYPNDDLTRIAGESISRFIKSDSPNLRCTGIIALCLIMQIDPKYVMNFQNIIVDCMEVNDETLKKYTFNLLYKMTSVSNAEIIVEKMIKYLANLKKIEKSKYNIEVLKKILELIERFSPSKEWFVKITNELFINFGEMIDNEIISKLIEIFIDWEKESDNLEEFKKLTIENFATIVENYSIIPSSFVQLIAIITGEYAIKLYNDDEEKIKGILEMMVYLLNKKYENKMTKCYILNAIMKIHSGINYQELNFVDEAINKYSKIKNPEIQQRCLEYKRSKEKNINQNLYPLDNIINNDNTSLKNNNIDFDLSFMNDYCKNNSNNKEYNSELSDYYMDKFSNTDKKLNIGPYQVTSNLLSMPGANSNMNNLYESNENYTSNIDMKNELKVKAEKKWGEEGYKKDDKSEEKKWGIEPIKIESIGSNSSNTNYYNDNNYKNNTKKNKIKEEEDPEKKKLMLDLFGGLSNEPQKVNKNNDNSTFNLFEGLTQNISNTNTNKNYNNNTNNQQNNINNNNFNINNNNNQNINFSLFYNLNLNNNSNTNFNNINNNFNNNNQNNIYNLFSPLYINTDKFGEFWETFPEEDSYTLNTYINSPQKYHEIIKSKGNFAAVDIINNEAISAANYKNQISLVHATIENNEINFLVKCQNKSLNNEVADLVMKLYK